MSFLVKPIPRHRAKAWGLSAWFCLRRTARLEQRGQRRMAPKGSLAGYAICFVAGFAFGFIYHHIAHFATSGESVMSDGGARLRSVEARLAQLEARAALGGGLQQALPVTAAPASHGLPAVAAAGGEMDQRDRYGGRVQPLAFETYVKTPKS